MVCLGKELGLDPRLVKWNRIRKQRDTPNKFEIIELRTAPEIRQVYCPTSPRRLGWLPIMPGLQKLRGDYMYEKRKRTKLISAAEGLVIYEGDSGRSC